MLDRHVAELSEFLSIPSVSGDPARRGAMREAAEWIAGQLSFANGRSVDTAGHPVVVGEWLGAPGAPTILVYGHYDVQPPGDESAWTTPPFAPAVRDGRIYARGATDDKGPLFVPLKVAEAFVAETGGLPLNVRFFFEGEEEIGSPSLPGFLREHPHVVAADLVVSADGAMWRATEPSVTVAAKGVLAVEIVVTGPAADLHSGRHGGAVENPLHALGRIVAGLHAPEGGVAVPGFYDGVVPLAAADREALARIPFDEERYRAQVGAPALHGEPGYTTLERLWTRPTLDVNSIEGGGRFTVIPSTARAYVTCRLVPDQDPETVVEAISRHVLASSPPGVEVAVEGLPGGVPAYAIPADHPAVLAAAQALRTVYPGSEPLLVRMGGSLPAAAMFDRLLGLKTLFFSFSTSDENLHAPDEFFRLDRLGEGIEAWSELWRLLALDGTLRRLG